MCVDLRNRRRAHPLEEVRLYSTMMLEELSKVIPSFLRRVEIAERGVQWSHYLADNKTSTATLLEDLFPMDDAKPQEESVRLVRFDESGEDRVIEAIIFANSTMSHLDAQRRTERMGERDKEKLFASYVGNRQNRRHRPGRAFEATDYRFELVTDYGAFRDLQRHRLLTIEWQPLSSDFGYDVPDIIRDSGLESEYAESLRRSHELYVALYEQNPESAQYAVALAFRIRYVIQMNARDAMHLIEVRSGPQGHPSYRRVAHEMHRLIREEAGHRLIAESMSYVDFSDTDLERLEAERAAERARAQRK